jgi:hypothetical protein
MSRKDDKKRKKREVRKKEAKKAEETRRLQLKREARDAVDNVKGIVDKLQVLFQEDAARAISLALNESLGDEEVAERLGVPVEQVTELMDLAAQLPNRFADLFREYPEAMANPEVLKAALDEVKQRGFQA